MFCKACCSEIKDGGKFCAKCGTPVGEAAFEGTPTSTNNQKKPHFRLFYIFPALFVLIILLTFSSGRADYTDAFDAYIKATMTGDAKAYVNLVPKEYIDENISNGRYLNKSEIIKDV